jgi:response regulator RpfG family c-di-GMP phosphodiesterase
MDLKILFVDDDTNLLSSWERNFRRFFKIETAEGAESALKIIAERGPFAVVVSDRQMPGMDGIQFLSVLSKQAPETVRIMLTGNANLEGAIQAVNDGHIFRFLTKPCPLELLQKVIEDGLRQYKLVTAERELLEKTLNGCIKLLTDILAMTEPQAFGHAEAMQELIAQAAHALHAENVWEMQVAAMLAPIGRVTVPPETLRRLRAGAHLSPQEQEVITQIPEAAARLLNNIPRLHEIARIVRYQHKLFDGRGFPEDAIKGRQIPLGARLLKILQDKAELEMNGATAHAVLCEMQSRTGWYDPELLTVIEALHGMTPEMAHATRPVVSLTMMELRTGMLLRSNIESSDGTLLLAAGRTINAMGLQRITNFSHIFGIREPIFVEAVEEE